MEVPGEVGEDLAQNDGDFAHALGAEEDPSEAGEMKHQDAAGPGPASRVGRAFHQKAAAPEVVDAQQGAMKCAPDHEGPGGTVPESAQQHRRPEVRHLAAGAASVAAQRDVDSRL